MGCIVAKSSDVAKTWGRNNLSDRVRVMVGREQTVAVATELIFPQRGATGPASRENAIAGLNRTNRVKHCPPLERLIAAPIAAGQTDAIIVPR